jgi:hypothetical protein
MLSNKYIKNNTIKIWGATRSLQLPSSEIGFLRGIVAEREREWREIESEIKGDSERGERGRKGLRESLRVRNDEREKGIEKGREGEQGRRFQRVISIENRRERGFWQGN